MKFNKISLTLKVVLLSLLCCDLALAQKTLFDIEPNNKPENAQIFRGEHQLKGSMDSEDQDLFLWDLTDASAGFYWDLVLTGIPESLTKVDLMKLEFTEDGKGVTQVHKLYSLSHIDGVGNVIVQDLLFSPGKYYVGFSSVNNPNAKAASNPLAGAMTNVEIESEEQKELLASGIESTSQKNYSLVFKKKRKIQGLSINKDNSEAKPQFLHKNRATGILLKQQPQWLNFKISQKETINTWSIQSRASVGNSLDLELFDNTGKQLAKSSTSNKGEINLSDLNFQEGEYKLKITSNTPNSLAKISINKSGAAIEGGELEPNNSLQTANKLTWNTEVKGKRNNSNDTDYFSFVIDDTKAGNNLVIELANSSQSSLELCLVNYLGASMKCKEKIGDMKLNNIVLASGQYYLYTYRGEVDTTYELSIKDLGKRNPIQEAEPNDKYIYAANMTKKRIIKGQFEGNEFDYFKFDVTEKPQLWTIQAVGSNITDIRIYNSGGRAIQSMSYPGNNKRARLSNLFLMPGKHVISLRGNNGKYLLRAFPIGPPDPDFEIEPNDDKSRSMLIKIGDVKKGILSEDADKDLFHFSLQNKERVQISIRPPKDGSIRYLLSWFKDFIADRTSKPGEPMVYKGLLEAGDYSIELKAAGARLSDSLYEVEFERLPLYSCLTDCEPNDTSYQANKISMSTYIEGRNKTHGDEDWYVLPKFDTETKLSLENLKPQSYLSLRLYDKAGPKAVRVKMTQDPENKNLQHFIVPAGVSPRIRIYGDENDYKYKIFKNDKVTSADLVHKLNVNLEISGLANQVAAYHPYAQKLKGILSLTNSLNQQQLLNLKTNTSDQDWDVLNLPDSITLTPNQALELPFEVLVGKDTRGLKSTRVSIVVQDSLQRNSETWQDINVSGQAIPVNSELVYTIPDPLLGGLNVAHESVGGKLTAADSSRLINKLGRGFEVLFNGYGFKGYGAQYRKRLNQDKDFITIKLAGSQDVEVSGIVLNPSSDVHPYSYLKDFEFQLSMDGIDFETVLSGQLTTSENEQSFVLAKSKKAQYARLILLSNQLGDERQVIGLGEWKVIANPRANILSGKGFNIADPKFGGYVAWSNPNFSGQWNSSLLNVEEKSKNTRSKSQNSWEWVVGFHNQRAALINQIDWQKPTLSSGYKTFDKVSIAIAQESPTGPWKLIGDYDLKANENTIKLDKNYWARYVKFSVGHVSPKESRYPPEIIKIFEVPTSEEYSSILGEWGELSQQAIYEQKHLNSLSKKAKDINNNSKGTALSILAKEVYAGRVQLEHADKPDWYQYTIPDGQNTLIVTLKGEPTVSTILTLENSQGELVNYTKDASIIGQITFQASVQAGKSYFLKVEEPPRSVIFSWDTSGSTSNYHAVIFQALNDFTDGVIKDRDLVNFIPFGGELLMDKWYGESYFLKNILNDYDRKDDSSSAEKTLIQASKALENRQGSKSIVLITDALTPVDKELWSHLNSVKPRVFSMGLIRGSSGNSHEIQFDLMQSWSRVNNGEFDRISSISDLEIVFDKAASKLRKPAEYSIEVDSNFSKAPGPGRLLVKNEQINTGTAVELILDASGSMLKRLNGKRRINIAKEVLMKTVTDIIPANTPLALRVFGDQQANACRTDLRLPLTPLNPAKAQSIIQKVNAKNLAKTPIADSLAKVQQDLKSHKGKKIVILLTDGEETCDGDPKKVIESMIDKGIDLRMNIVGFAINEEKLKSEFSQWSKLGNGKYFDSNDPESLKTSIEEALRTPYSVFTQSGELVAEGTVNGDSLVLPAGFYDIKIYSDKVSTHKNYQIKGELDQIITL